MFTCKYCGVHYQTFHSICPSCGAPVHVEIETAEKTEAQIRCDKVRRICDHYLNREFDDNRDFKDGESISDKRIDTIRNSFRAFPIGKEIYLYCDTSPIRNGKHGFIICEDGVYWQNSWTTPTNRNFLSWDVLKKRAINHKKFDLDLGKGDVIEMAGLGSKEIREDVTRFFKELQASLSEQKQEQK